MTGISSPTSLFSSHKFHHRNPSSTMSLGTTPAPAPAENKPTSSNGGPVGASNPPAGQAGEPGAGAPKQVQEVLSSEIAIATMLNRLKQSISAAKEFALFLKKRSALEEELAHGLKKLCRMSQENARRPEHKQGTFAQAFDDMLTIHDRMAENGLQFASSLHTMHDDLMELASISERNRKSWKVNGLSAEQRVADIEAGVKKSKTKYDSLAEEYDRARMGDPSKQTGRAFFKGPKSAAEREEELLRKVQAADTDYHGKVQVLQTERAELLSRTRPEAVKAIQDLVRETDSGVGLQMQKFASFNEKLLLSNGLCISPIKNGDAPQHPRSLRDATASIDNEKDMNDYLMAYHPKVPLDQGEPKYEKNPVLNPPGQPLAITQGGPAGGRSSPPASGQFAVQPPPIQTSHPQPPGSAPGSSVDSPVGSPGTTGPIAAAMNAGQLSRPSSQQQQHAAPQQHNRNISTASMLSHATSAQQSDQNNRHSFIPGNGARASWLPGSASSQGPPQLGALAFQPPSAPAQGPQAHQRDSGGYNPLMQNPPNSQGGSGPPLMAPVPLSAAQQQAAPAANMERTPPPPAEAKRVFGISLNKLYERDGLVVPMVVYQCIQAVDLFGLNMEGIYRQSGSLNSVNRLKTMFDADSSNPMLDFRNPENFFHDVNSVTGLLKQFFRDLPDPLLTAEHHQAFIEAGKQDDPTVRRDSLHFIINSLPDPNYATLRALTLHLHRIMDNSHANRMNSHNLAVIFGPTLMGSGAPGMGIEDAGWQIKVVDTILENTYSIFDDE